MAKIYFHIEGPLEYHSVLTTASGVPVATEISADQYLMFAKADFGEGSTRGLTNALGNAKRALHLTIDNLLQNYGLLSQNSNTRFPQRLELLDRAGLISLNVFRKLNIERNAVEHDYVVPSKERIEDFIDVCQLLSLAAAHLAQEIAYRTLVGVRSSKQHAVMVLEPGLGKIDFYEVISPELTTFEKDGYTVQYAIPMISPSGRDVRSSVSPDAFASINLRAYNWKEWVEYIRLITEEQQGGGSSQASTSTGADVTIWSSQYFPASLITGSPFEALFGPYDDSRSIMSLGSERARPTRSSSE